jgi:uncharacterized protein
MILPFLYIAPASMGRGVFTAEDIAEGTTIEISPVIAMTGEERKLLDQTLLHDYIFEWGEDNKGCCMALGYVPIYNHSYKSNCEYEMPARLGHSAGDFETEQITIITMRDIKAGEELFINYNGSWNDKTPVWFDKK